MKRWLMTLLLLPSLAVAEDSAVVRAELLPDDIEVGNSATLRITVLGPTWFPKAPVFPSLEVPNALVELPPNSSMSISGQVNGETWNGVVRDYRVTPLLPARFSLGGQVIRVTVANPGNDPVVTDVTIPKRFLSARVPEGAEGLDPYLAGNRFQLTRTLDDTSEELAVGDAVVITTTAEVEGLPALFLPPLSPTIEWPGVSAYPEEPLLEQDGNTARRTEKVTLVFGAGGQFELPEFQLAWWNTKRQSVETVMLEPLSMSVDGPPAVESAPATSVQDQVVSGWQWLGWVALVLLAAWRLIPGLTSRWQARQQRHFASESFAFKKLQSACHSGNAREAYLALNRWLERLSPGSKPEDALAAMNDPQLMALAAELSATLYGAAKGKVNLDQLSASLASARKSQLAAGTLTPSSTLPPLNP